MTDNERAAVRRLLWRWGCATQACRRKHDEIREYETLIEALHDLKPQKLTGMPHGTGKSDPTAMSAERVDKLRTAYLRRIDDIMADIDDLMIFSAVIDDILTEFPADEREVVELRYRRFNGARKDLWTRTARQMSLSEDGAKKVERKAVDRMAGYVEIKSF